METINETLREKLQDERNDLEWLRHPEFWAHYPLQPLIKADGYGGTGPMSSYGVVAVDSNNVCVPVVHNCLLYGELFGKGMDDPHDEFKYETIEAMLADGWEID